MQELQGGNEGRSQGHRRVRRQCPKGGRGIRILTIFQDCLFFKWGGWRWFGVCWGVCGEVGRGGVLKICFTANNWRGPNKLSAPIERRLTPIERRLTPLSAPIERRLTPPMTLLAAVASSAPTSRTYRRLSRRLAHSLGRLALGRTLPLSVHTRQGLRGLL